MFGFGFGLLQELIKGDEISWRSFFSDEFSDEFIKQGDV